MILNAKIMDSGVSGIQMWPEQKKEKQEKRRAHYEKNREKSIEKVVEGRKKSPASKSRQLWFVPIRDATKKHRHEQNQNVSQNMIAKKRRVFVPLQTVLFFVLSM